MDSTILISIVVPFYNEEEGAADFANALLKHFPDNAQCRFEFVFVDDGSNDRTPELLERPVLADSRAHLLRLSVNAGQQCALVAGIDAARGDAVLTMDGDGQHPFQTAAGMIRLWIENPRIDLIQAVRKGVQGGTLKNLSSHWFYTAIRLLVPEVELMEGSSDFRLVSRATVNTVSHYRDRHRNLRLLFASLGVTRIHVEYEVEPRRHGQTRYSVRKMIKLAADGVFAFSFMPLRLILILVAATGTTSLAFLAYAVLRKTQGEVVPGWTSTVVCLTGLFFALFVVLAIMAEYIARIYEEVKGRPPYVLRDRTRPPRQTKQ